MAQSMLLVSVEAEAAGRHRVHLKLDRSVMPYGSSHPELLSTEAAELARDIGNAAAECQRKNIRKNL